MSHVQSSSRDSLFNDIRMLIEDYIEILFMKGFNACICRFHKKYHEAHIIDFRIIVSSWLKLFICKNSLCHQKRFLSNWVPSCHMPGWPGRILRIKCYMVICTHSWGLLHRATKLCVKNYLDLRVFYMLNIVITGFISTDRREASQNFELLGYLCFMIDL